MGRSRAGFSQLKTTGFLARPEPGLAREMLSSSGGSHSGFCGGSFDRRDDMVCANPTLEQMARYWFYFFGTNPSAESFVHSRAL
jgi:hypothetical protein